jgi:alpha-N-arabinofuranosidase
VEVNGPDIKAENDFGSSKVGTTARSAAAQGKKFTQTFAPHSYTMVKVKLA